MSYQTWTKTKLAIIFDLKLCPIAGGAMKISKQTYIANLYAYSTLETDLYNILADEAPSNFDFVSSRITQT